MYYYNFLLFFIGELKFVRGSGRREIGYGVLVERVFEFVIFLEDEFFYIIWFVFEVLIFNGLML